MKYITIKTEEGKELLMIFPEVMVHKEFFTAIQAMKVFRNAGQSWSRPYRSAECISAGFTSIDGYCGGESESLGVKSRGTADAELLRKNGK